MKKSFVILVMLMLVFPTLHAQNIDYLQKAREFLSQGDCERAELAYQDYKREYNKGNAEVEAGIKRCKDDKNAIKPGTTTTPKKRSTVEVLYGYLKIFPNELGTFQAEPTIVISQINAQAQHGYNNWRIPTNEELSLMRANNYLGYGEYMTKESKHGIVLLVSGGKDYATLQAEEQERQRIAALKAQDYVDLGLPSGTLWKDKNESGFYDYDAAVRSFGSKLPTKEQLEELKNSCQWTWTGSGYKVVGSNGNFIVLPAAGFRSCGGGTVDVGSYGGYWSSTPNGSDIAWNLYFYSSKVGISHSSRCGGRSVRLVQD